MGQSKDSYVIKQAYPGAPWYHCGRCGRDGYAGTLGHGCTDCDNHFSHGLCDPVDQDADESTMERYSNEGGK